jgi:hypothetical protein
VRRSSRAARRAARRRGARRAAPGRSPGVSSTSSVRPPPRAAAPRRPSAAPTNLVSISTPSTTRRRASRVPRRSTRHKVRVVSCRRGPWKRFPHAPRAATRSDRPSPHRRRLSLPRRARWPTMPRSLSNTDARDCEGPDALRLWRTRECATRWVAPGSSRAGATSRRAAREWGPRGAIPVRLAQTVAARSLLAGASVDAWRPSPVPPVLRGRAQRIEGLWGSDVGLSSGPRSRSSRSELHRCAS